MKEDEWMPTTRSFFVYKIVTQTCVSKDGKCEKNIFYSFLGWPVTTKLKVKVCFTEFYKLIDFKTNPFIGVQRIESEGEVFHEKSGLKHIRSAIVVKNSETYLRGRLVLINFTEELTLSQILLKVFDHM